MEATTRGKLATVMQPLGLPEIKACEHCRMSESGM